MNGFRVAVVVATKGRPTEVGQLLQNLQRQTQPPSAVVLSISEPGDLPPEPLPCNPLVLIGPAGLCRQRNRALERLAGGACDVIAFFDDDYLPDRRAVAGLARFYADNPDVAGANGLLLADGINAGGLGYAEASKLISAYDDEPPQEVAILRELESLYGCNMTFRADRIGALRFDEALPLYGWQEDVDFSRRVRQHGRLVRTNAFAGVHRGVRGGRTSGVRLGYSQIANPVYLLRKGTLQRHQAVLQMARNFAANHVRMIRPEPWVDRHGRARGNWLAIADLLRGTASPGRVLDL